MFRKSARRNRQQRDRQQRQARRRRLANLVSRRPQVEALEDRRLLAVVTYDAGTNALTFNADAGDVDDVQIVGDIGANTLTITVDNADVIALAGDAVANADFTLSTTTTADDTLTIAVGGSAVSDLVVNAGDMDDTIDTSQEDGVSTNSITINGDAGADELVGSAFIDTINGGAGDDTITGGMENDTIDGGDDGDTIIWNNGDGSDTINGGTGVDTVEVNGSTVTPADDDFTISAIGARFAVTRAGGGVGLGSFGLDIGGVERLELNTFDGDDSITVDDLAGVADLQELQLNGGVGLDDFDVVPSMALISIDGGDPVAAPGDELTIDLAGTTGADLTLLGPGAGDINFTSGEAPVIYFGIETLDPQNGTLALGPINTGAGDDSIVVSNDGGDLVIEIGGAEFARVALAIITGPLIINGEDGDDDLTVDFSGGNPVPAGGLEFNGGTQATAAGDLLVINGTFINQTITFDDLLSVDGFSGDLDLDGSLITFSGLEPINAGNSVNTTLNLPLGLTNDAVLQNSANAGEIEFIDNGATFENTIIPNPTGSLTLNLGNSGNQLQVNALDAAFAASLIINGGVAATDNVQLTGVNLDTANNGRGLWVTETETLGITGGTISNNTAPIGGGILIDNSTSGTPTTATVSGAIIDANTATGGVAPIDGGGGIFNRGGGNLIVSAGTMITGNTATTANGSGGGIFSSGVLTVNDSTIDGNSANRAGGGIEISGMSGLTTLTNVILTNNQALGAPGNGGGMHLTGAADGIITGGMITGNTAALEGGGLWNGGGTMTIDATTISGNTASGPAADDGGGGIFNNGGIVDIGVTTPVDITNNVADGASGSGGGIFNNTGGIVTVNRGSVSGNAANRAGGGIEDASGAGMGILLASVALDNNMATGGGNGPGNGGGLHVSGSGDVNVIGGTVNGNTAALEGGGLWNGGGTMTINGTTINGNTASGPAADDGGGGIFNNGGTLTIGNTTPVDITNNVADGASGSGGGIFNNTGGTVAVNGSSIGGNTANRAGGGIEDASGAGLGITLTNVALDNNMATGGGNGPGNGGGLHVSGPGDVNITGGTVNGNSAAEEGGGLWNNVGTMTVDGTTISGNAADGAGFDQGGGGIFNAGGILIVGNATIDNNTADNTPGAGGGILSDGGFTSVTNSTITNNDNYGIRIINGSGDITGNTFGGNVTADLLIDGTNANDLFFVNANSVFFGVNFISYDGTVPDLDIRGLDGDDTFNVMPSVDTQIFIDGGSPVTPATPGDTLNLTLQNEANVFSDKAVPPNVSITTTVAGVPTQPVTFLSIETFLAAPGPSSQTVNFIGDNNGATPQTDNLEIIGRDVDSAAPPLDAAQPQFQPDADGVNEFQWSLNGSPDFGFRNVAFLNFDSGELVDTLDITPYADDRPQGWDIDVFYNEGAPAGADGAQVDLLIYNTAAFGGMVSEDIRIRPSGPDNGELVVTNLGFGTPIVDIDFVANTDIIINDNDGFLNDTDTLTLLGSDPSNPGTSGIETAIVDFTAVGGVGSQQIRVQDGPSILYAVRNFTGFSSIDFALLGGDDTLNFTPDTANANGLQNVVINYDGGDPVASDSLIVNAATNARVTQGAISTSGVVDQLGAGNVNYSNVESATFNSATAASTLRVRATNDQDTIAATPFSTTTRVWINDGTVITANAANANFSSVTIDGRFGDDEFSITPSDIAISVIGGDPAASDSVTINGMGGADTVTYTPVADDGGTVLIAGLGPVAISTVESLIYDGQGGDDLVTISGAGQFVHTPGTDSEDGNIQLASLLALGYENLGNDGSITASGTGANDTLRFLDTETADLILVAFAGADAAVIQQVSSFGSHANVLTTGVERYVIDSAQPGGDFISVNGPVLASGSFLVTGNGTSDTLLLNSGPGVTDVRITPAAGISGLTLVDGFGTPNFSVASVEQISYQGIATDNLTVNPGLGDNQVKLERGDTGQDLLTSDALPPIRFSSVAALTVDNLFGTDEFEVHPTNLSGATSYTFTGALPVDDVLRIVGTEAIDTVTSNADTVTFNGVLITAGANLAELRIDTLGGNDSIDLDLNLAGTRKVIDAGDGDDSVDLSGMQDALVFGGLGNDLLIGSPLADTIFGGPGNDILIGGGGDDFQYGEDGNDIFGNPTLAADGVADDPGTDHNFGGNGFDNFIWEPGDGTDFNNGGDDGADIFRFFGRAAADTMTLQPGGTPTHFNALFNGAVIDNHGIEDVIVDPLGGNDIVTINDLFTTEVINITVSASGGDEVITVVGRTTDDQLQLTASGPATVAIEGLTYDVSVRGSDLADNLIVNTVQGDDSINVATGVEALVTTTIIGGVGDDALSGAFSTAAGRDGNDTISGAPIDQTIDGGAGDDTIFISGGNDTIDGGAGNADKLVYLGTRAADDLSLSESAGTITVSGLITGTVVPSNVEQIEIDAAEGDDTSTLTELTIPTRFIGGAGNDSVIATTRNADNSVASTTPAALELLGGPGDDTLIGGSGNDRLEGGDGDDVMEGAQGMDRFFGGDGSDYFRWIAGDGSDLMEGGSGETDQLIFIASDMSNLLQLYGGGLFSNSLAGFFLPQTLENSTRAIFELNAGQIFLNTGDIESVYIDALGGDDNIVINNQVDTTSRGDSPVGGGVAISQGTDLAATAVQAVEVLPGAGDDYIGVHGTAGDDNIDAAVQGGVVTVEGASVLVEIGSAGAGADTLHIHGQAGNDNLKAAAGTENTIAITIEGDAGDDLISADAILIGGAGDDTLIGGAGNDTAIGNAGDDTYVIHDLNQGGTDSFDGGDGFDTVLVQGEAGPDVITVDEAAGAHTIAINAGGPTILDATSVFERLLVDTGEGDDMVTTTGAVVGLEVQLGAGDDILDAELQTTAVLAFGGQGNDTLTGSDPVDGAAINDRLFGGDGDDIIEGGRGRDEIFGGADNDYIIWRGGDGSDLMEGGSGEADQLAFIASDMDNLLQLYGGGLFNDSLGGFFLPQTLGNSTRAIFELNAGQIFLNTGDIESIEIDALGGNDNIVINNQVDATSRGDSPVGGGVGISQGTDLAATAVQAVEVLPGAGDDYIDVHGSAGDDNIDAAVQGGVVTVEGASVLVEIGSAGAGSDTLHIHGQTGNDNLKAAAGTENTIAITIEGDAGDDFISADAILIGGAGDDFLQGGAGDDLFFGGAGEDTIVGGAGNDTIDGGADFDTILIEGTSGDDIIDVFQANPTTLNHTVNGDAQVDTLVVSTVEQARVVAGEGADLIRVNWQDAIGVNGAVDSLRMTVDGGSDATSDRLVVVDDGTDDLVLYRKGQANDSGTVQVGPGNAEPLLNVFSGIENIDFIDENGGAIVNGAGAAQLVVFKHDPFESNDDRFTATYLGSGDTINVDPTIDPGPLANPFGDGQNLVGDSDYYRVVAEATGTLDLQIYFRQVGALPSGRPGLPNDGNLDINVRDAAGNIIAGFGVNDASDDERVRIPAVEGQAYYLEVFGNGDAINVYNFTVVNHAPPVPFDLELLDNPADGTTNPPGGSVNSDTGRSPFDNHTYDDTPTLYFRLDDGIFLNDLPGNPATGTPPDEIIPIPFQAGVAQPNTPGYAIAIFDEGNTPPQTGTAVQTPLGFATAVPGQQGIYTFTVPGAVALSEGSHFLSARVQMIDPANPQETGFGDRSVSLEIVVDTTPPPVFFGLQAVGTDGLHPDSDSGDAAIPATFVDRITNDETPTFFGRAEANSIIRAYVDLDNSSSLTAADLLIGQTVANPLDGTEQLETPANPLEPGGQWQFTSTVNMNDPRILTALGLPKDGLRRILISAEDLAGNITAPDANEILEIFVDTQGPQVTGVFITAFPAFDIFTLKPETPQPTPRVDSLTIAVRDLPPRIVAFLYGAVSNVPPLAPVVLIGDHSGVIPISNLAYNSLNNGPGIATAEIVLDFASPLPDDRFTLTLADTIIDPAGNQLDGENNAVEPIGTPFFPTGDQIPGGDFIARFTVDSRPEVGTWAQGVVYVDINGNFVWDPEGQDNDAVNRDFAYNFGEVTDAYFAGNFSSNATSSGFDKIGAYGAFNGTYEFLLDTNDDGVGDLVAPTAFQVNAIPVAGNFSNSAADIAAVAAGQRPRDEIGAFDGQNWYLDINGNNQIDANERFATDLRGIPIVGDFNGDGNDDLATYNNDSGTFQFDLDRNGTIDDQVTFGFSGFGERPVTGDINLDGIDDLVLWVPKQAGQLPKDSGEFHFLVSDRTSALPRNVFDPFSPSPLGNDLISQFGDDFALPVFGNFDPPIADDGNGATFIGSQINPLNPLDTNVDGNVTALDALVVINSLARNDFNQVTVPSRIAATSNGFRLDASQDGVISALDALRVINGLGQVTLESEAAGEQSVWATSADSVFSGLGEDDDDDLLAQLAADQEQQRIKS